MIINFADHQFDAGRPIDISISLNFNGPQPNAYGVEPAVSSPCKAGDIVGDTRLGGSCNFEQYTFTPHCSGTHTECVGHITNERISVRDALTDVLIPALLITAVPEWTGGSDDLIISRDTIESAVAASIDSGDALIVRTLPNDAGKLTREYGDDALPSYFSAEAIEYIADCGFRHLLVDLPSIDRLFDDGKLANHRIFWNVEPGSFELNNGTRRHSTITELIYVPNEVEDGLYMLNLQIAPFAADASPSRPVLFRIDAA